MLTAGLRSRCCQCAALPSSCNAADCCNTGNMRNAASHGNCTRRMFGIIQNMCMQSCVITAQMPYCILHALLLAQNLCMCLQSCARRVHDPCTLMCCCCRCWKRRPALTSSPQTAAAQCCCLALSCSSSSSSGSNSSCRRRATASASCPLDRSPAPPMPARLQSLLLLGG